jgi:hypothetical protein
VKKLGVVVRVGMGTEVKMPGKLERQIGCLMNAFLIFCLTPIITGLLVAGGLLVLTILSSLWTGSR